MTKSTRKLVSTRDLEINGKVKDKHILRSKIRLTDELRPFYGHHSQNSTPLSMKEYITHRRST